KYHASHAEHRAIAIALGDLMDRLGYADAGALCRAPQTMHVLAAWDRDRAAGRRAMRRALAESGVEPPDTDALTWAGIMGPVEASAFDAAATALEQALIEGVFTPGRPGWRRSQAALVRRFLTTPVHWLDE